MAAYRKTWDLFFAYHQPGQAFDVEELQMCVGDTVAFAVAIMRCGSATVSRPPAPGGFQVSVGTELDIAQAGVPDVIPPEACYLGWQESLRNLARLVEPEINQ